MLNLSDNPKFQGNARIAVKIIFPKTQFCEKIGGYYKNMIRNQCRYKIVDIRFFYNCKLCNLGIYFDP